MWTAAQKDVGAETVPKILTSEAILFLYHFVPFHRWSITHAEVGTFSTVGRVSILRRITKEGVSELDVPHKILVSTCFHIDIQDMVIFPIGGAENGRNRCTHSQLPWQCACQVREAGTGTVKPFLLLKLHPNRPQFKHRFMDLIGLWDLPKLNQNRWILRISGGRSSHR